MSNLVFSSSSSTGFDGLVEDGASLLHIIHDVVKIEWAFPLQQVVFGSTADKKRILDDMLMFFMFKAGGDSIRDDYEDREDSDYDFIVKCWSQKNSSYFRNNTNKLYTLRYPNAVYNTIKREHAKFLKREKNIKKGKSDNSKKQTYWTIESKIHRLKITDINEKPVACCGRSYVVLTHKSCQSLLKAYYEGNLKAISMSLMKIWIYNQHHIYEDRTVTNNDNCQHHNRNKKMKKTKNNNCYRGNDNEPPTLHSLSDLERGDGEFSKRQWVKRDSFNWKAKEWDTLSERIEMFLSELFLSLSPRILQEIICPYAESQKRKEKELAEYDEMDTSEGILTQRTIEAASPSSQVAILIVDTIIDDDGRPYLLKMQEGKSFFDKRDNNDTSMAVSEKAVEVFRRQFNSSLNQLMQTFQHDDEEIRWNNIWNNNDNEKNGSDCGKEIEGDDMGKKIFWPPSSARATKGEFFNTIDLALIRRKIELQRMKSSDLPYGEFFLNSF